MTATIRQAEREPGFYWVKYSIEGVFEGRDGTDIIEGVAEWGGKYWWVTGFDWQFDDDKFIEIDEKRLIHIEQPPQI